MSKKAHSKNEGKKIVDAVTTKAGKVIERIQYKDTVSPSGNLKTVRQAASGKYQQV